MFSFVCSAAKIKKNKEERIKIKQGVRFADDIKNHRRRRYLVYYFLFILSSFFFIMRSWIFAVQKRILPSMNILPSDGA